MSKFNSSELDDLNYLLNKIINGESFYALEVSKARYLSSKIKEQFEEEEKEESIEEQREEMFVDDSIEHFRETVTKRRYPMYWKNDVKKITKMNRILNSIPGNILGYEECGFIVGCLMDYANTCKELQEKEIKKLEESKMKTEITEKNENKGRYQIQVCMARIKLKKGLVIDAYDILGGIIKDMNDISGERK